MTGAMCAVLTACNSTSAFDERVTLAETLLDDISTAGATPVLAMPTSGSADYTGVSIVEFAESEVFLGAAQVSVGFAGAGTVTGILNNFRDESDEAIGGALTISGGTISGNSIDFNTAGTLDVSRSGPALSVDIDVDNSGGFSGHNAKYLTTLGIGTADFSDASTNDVGILIVGEAN